MPRGLSGVLVVRITLLYAVIAFSLAGCSGDDGTPALGQERIDSDEPRIAEEMIEAIETISLRRAGDNDIVHRVNQAKSLACLNAEFRVSDNLPRDLRQGLFASPATYPAVVRFANASSFDDREKDFHGMSIKVSGISGQPLWGQPGQQDFLLNSYPALFAANPREFLAFLKAETKDARWRFFINPANWDSLTIILKGRKRIDSPLDIRYWSTTPYRFGSDPGAAVKYSARPCSMSDGAGVSKKHENYLRDAVHEQLQRGDACFDFMVQFQRDAHSMPIEDASIIWEEDESPFRKLATIRIPQQDFRSRESMTQCENMQFNPWQSLEAHKPLGGINRVRREVYTSSADFRIQHNQHR